MTAQRPPHWPPENDSVGETLHDYFTKEEDFLAEYAPSAQAASSLVRDKWRPNPNCNDVSRRQRDMLLQTGALIGLAFDAAAVYHNPSGHSSVRIVLRSRERVVTVRVSLVDGALMSEVICDRRLDG
jgi:hypothetical protein